MSFTDSTQSSQHVVVRLKWDKASLHQFFETPGGVIGQQVTRITLKVESGAKSLAPVDTGRLRSSISRRIELRGAEIVGIVGTDVEYAPHQEFGTRFLTGKAFLRGGLAAAAGVL